MDVELIPELDYNVTSYFACYKSTKGESTKGTNPNIWFYAYKGNPVWGCKGSWQGKIGKLSYFKKDPADEKKEVEDTYEIKESLKAT